MSENIISVDIKVLKHSWVVLCLRSWPLTLTKMWWLWLEYFLWIHNHNYFNIKPAQKCLDCFLFLIYILFKKESMIFSKLYSTEYDWTTSGVKMNCIFNPERYRLLFYIYIYFCWWMYSERGLKMSQTISMLLFRDGVNNCLCTIRESYLLSQSRSDSHRCLPRYKSITLGKKRNSELFISLSFF